MITFKLSFSTGQNYTITDNSNKLFKLVLNKFLLEHHMNNPKITSIVCKGDIIDMDKSLLDNKIKNNDNVVICIKEPLQQINTINVPFNNNNIKQPNNILKNHTLNPSKTLPNLKQEILKFTINQYDNPYLKKGVQILINGCNVPIHMLDRRGHTLGGWRIGKKNGPPGFLKDYIPPLGWTGIGLKVVDLFDKKDNTWLGTSNNMSEWYIAYHAIKTINSISGIINNGFRRGPFQEFKNKENLNPLSKKLYPLFGEGVYFLPNFNEVKKDTRVFNYLGTKFRVIFMCRINPYKVRISTYGLNEEIWIVNGDRLDDINGRKRDDEVRLYRILIYIEGS